MAYEINISATSGLTLYFQIANRSGQIFNLGLLAFEASNPANWGSYANSLIEVIPGSGQYFGSLPPGALPAGLYLIPVLQQSGTTPATTDPLQGINLQLDWSGIVTNSLTLLSTGGGGALQVMPRVQDSPQNAQAILNALYNAVAALAANGIASVTIDGEQTVFTSQASLQKAVHFWQAQVALLTGRRRRASGIRLA